LFLRTVCRAQLLFTQKSEAGNPSWLAPLCGANGRTKRWRRESVCTDSRVLQLDGALARRKTALGAKFFLRCEGGSFAKEKCASKQKYSASFLGAQTDASKVSTAKKCPFHRRFCDSPNFVHKIASNKKYFCVRQRQRALFASTEGEARGSYTQV